MFVSEIKDKLIKELNMQIEDGTFYTMNDLSKFANKKDDVDNFDSIKYECAPSYSGLAKITGIDLGNSATVQKSGAELGNVNSYFESLKKEGSNLYRPMISKFNNSLDKNPYAYKSTFDVAVNGMAFISKNGGIVENPLSKNVNIVNNLATAHSRTPVNTEKFVASAEKNMTPNESEKGNDAIDTNKNLLQYKVEPIAINTYNMLDILQEAGSSEELIFNAIPKEYALTTVSKWSLKNILFRGWKKLFSK